MASPPLMTLRGGRISFGGKPLFADVDLQLGRGDRACLVGRNGSGKSTLLKILSGLVEIDHGELFLQPGTKASYLPQDPVFAPDETVARYVAADGEPAHRVDAMLAQVELDGARRLGTLSGGEGRRAALARALVGEPDILLLDEPTNHLDLAAIDWLERVLTGFGGALLMVSHDRAFLNRVTTRTFWLDRGRLRRNDSGFADFDAWSEAVLEAELREAERLDSKLRDETHWLLRGVTARRRRNQGRLRKLETMRAARAALLGGRGGKAKIAVEDGEIRSRLVIEAKDIAKSFLDEDGRERVIVRGFSTRVLRGDRIGLVGANGAGKTTLLRMLTGDLAPDRGSVRLAKNLTRAYFDQHRATLDREATLWDTLCPAGGDQVMVHGKPRHVRAYLKDFLFDPRQADSPVGSLSGGERNRLLLAKIMATPSELLVLDEPTNDLDMDTLDLLQEMLADYPGTLLLVSHDRDFLDKTVNGTIVMEGDGSAIEYAGGYSDYLAQRGARTAPRADAAAPARPAAPRKSRRPEPRQRLGYKEQRDLALLPERIAALEAEIASLGQSLADPTLYNRDRAAFERMTARMAEARVELDSAETRWLELDARRDALSQSAGGQ